MSLHSFNPEASYLSHANSSEKFSQVYFSQAAPKLTFPSKELTADWSKTELE